MELRHLRYFLAVAEEGHITRAAEKLFMQQPPLSQQIKALETEIGAQLFHRRPRGVELTEAGAAFRSDIAVLLTDLERAISRAQRVSRGEEGSIAVGFTNSGMFHDVVKTSLRDFRKRFPDVHVTLNESGSSELLAAVCENRIDVAFIRTDAAAPDTIRIVKILDEPVMLAIPEAHPLAQECDRPAKLADLAGEALILYRRSSGPALHDRIIAACLDAGFTPTISQEVPHVVSTLNLVAAGLGISIVPEALCRSHLEGVTFRPLAAPSSLTVPLRLALRKNDPSEPVAAFVQSVATLKKSRPKD